MSAEKSLRSMSIGASPYEKFPHTKFGRQGLKAVYKEAVAPTIEAGIADHIWDLAELLA